MYEQRRLYFHLRAGGQLLLPIGIPLSPRCGAKAGILTSK